ncbi:hypothetical protein KM908_14285 [Alkalihalobacillus clausii]|uniref:hypothetical protein n=1 Tax=Shouchella clausii TaxID=79880 RepID=UPI001C22CD44|nr:hypothetical protein [Shouchella clausii]MBU8597310.1 hypothetical protein [Shouchella clausii]
MKLIISPFVLSLFLLVGCVQADEGYAFKITVNDGEKETEYVADRFTQRRGGFNNTLSIIMFDKEGDLIADISGEITVSIERIEADE